MSDSRPLYAIQCHGSAAIIRRRDAVVGVLERRGGLVPSREISLWLGADENVDLDVDDSDACTIVPGSSSESDSYLEKLSTRPGGYRTKLVKWLRTPRFSRYPVTFSAEGKTFEWRESAAGLLVAREAGQRGDPPIAYFQHSRAAASGRVESATLTFPRVDDSSLAEQDAIFISLVAIAQRQGSACSGFRTPVLPEAQSRHTATVCVLFRFLLLYIYRQLILVLCSCDGATSMSHMNIYR
ncbi:hypothetical protein CONPUDRAFT_135310 [Coniophora puteana RWD-64-598 SS2]|uniref:Uncharacterized protein n=1 Tax=Coniophora puteana (strain RWD-64-598) TaxID=741705 RepID=A0A5M3N2N6_CONPW|nr:uncharacterized protein CONPUDRAFT_135310 [Coniophora puteana RWD-64-598 SS2]EIW85650.1 hypothetical protein CONPUDRAFT_135310 [Coniophora puteana RWD-64-598 SS2]